MCRHGCREAALPAAFSFSAAARTPFPQVAVMLLLRSVLCARDQPPRQRCA
jgi:hypothetical protein